MSVIDYKDDGRSWTSEERIIKRINELSVTVKNNNEMMAKLMERLEHMDDINAMQPE